MTEPTQDPNNNTPRFRAAFAKLLAQIREVPDSEFVPINIDVESSVTTALGAGPTIRAQREQIVNEAPSFDISYLDNLELYTLALGQAHTVYETAMQPPASLVALGNEGSLRRTVMVSDATMLIARGLLKGAVLDDIKNLHGYKNVGFDLLRLANIYRDNWDNIADRTSINEQELNEVEDMADKLVTAVGERDLAPQALAQVVRDRQAAFTLFITAYDDVRAVIGFLRRKKGDVDTIAPSLYAGRAVTKKKPADGNQDNPQPPAPAAPNANQPATPGANVAPVAKTDVSESGPYMHG